MANDSIKIHIGAKDTASAVIQGVTARAVALGVTMGNLATKMITGTVNAFRSMIGAALDSEKASTQMDSALRSMGAYTPETAKQMRDLASAIKDETGASGASTKAGIAQLLMLGVTTDKMGVAARSVSALAAMGRDGSRAMVAVARALNGDIAAFERFSPEVRNATTITDKYAAANRYLAAGYEQQKANLQTVGGALEALNGRLKEGRVKIIEAVFAGLRLGSTFNDMQAAAGKFLKSEAFTRITDALRNGASYALDIGKALTAEGGAKEVGGAIGNVILAALKDGADYIGQQIKNAFTSEKGVNPVDFIKSEKVRGEAEKKAFSESSFWDKMGFEGTRKSMAAGEAAVQAWFKTNFSNFSGGRLDKALANLTAVVDKNVAKAEEQSAAQDDGMDAYLAYLSEQKVLDDQAQAMDKAAALAKQKLAATEREKADAAERTLRWDQMSEAFAKEEAEARSKISRNQQRLNDLASKNVAEYIADAQRGRVSEKDRSKAESRMQRKLDTLSDRQSRGIKLSERDAQMLNDAKAQEKLRKAANDQMIQGRKDALEAEKLRKESEAQTRKLHEKSAKHLESIDAKIEDAISDGGN